MTQLVRTIIPCLAWQRILIGRFDGSQRIGNGPSMRKKTLEQYAEDYRKLSLKKKALFRKMESLIRGKRITLVDSPDTDHIKGKWRTFIANSSYFLSGDFDDEGDLSIVLPAPRRKRYYVDICDVIIDEDPLLELTK